jgi:hypothetical protein
VHETNSQFPMGRICRASTGPKNGATRRAEFSKPDPCKEQKCNRSLAGLRPRTIMISDDHLGCLILVGIKSRYILAGTLSFQASSSSLHTCIKYYFVCTQRGLLLSAPSAVAFDGITLLVTPSLAMSSPLFVFAAFLLLLRMALLP